MLVALPLLTQPAGAGPVRAEEHDAFWLWAGVKPQAVLARAKSLYLLAGEVTQDGRLIAQRAAVPHVTGPKLWIVFRAQTIEWDEAVMQGVLAQVARWQKAGNAVTGLQVDFDAGTRHLDRYAGFLGRLRARLPADLHLGVTGLLDWSAHGDPAGLDALAGVADEVVLQIYQGRRVIPGYQAYLAQLTRMKLPFRIGLLQGGDWQPPPELESNPQFRGTVVFLNNGGPK